MTSEPLDFDALHARLDALAPPAPDADRAAVAIAADLLGLSERILETWLVAHDAAPTGRRKEGFRLLALHSQGARGDPSFNACRETCREIVFQHNVVAVAATGAERAAALGLMVMVVRHLALFVAGKLEVAGLGEFCCASKPLRRAGEIPAAPATA